MDEPAASILLAKALNENVSELGLVGQSVVFMCIGTDRSTGDSLGPLVGSRLLQHRADRVHIYGTLDKPVHAANLAETLDEVTVKHPQSVVIAIDACLGKSEHVGHIGVRGGPLLPGRGVNKRLPPVGHIHIIGIVNVGGFMEYFVLQNTRLHLVMRMADAIANALGVWLENHSVQMVQQPSRFRTSL